MERNAMYERTVSPLPMPMKDNPYIHLLLASWENARERRPMLLLSIACFVVANSIMLLQPFIFAQVLNTIQIGGEGLWK